MRAIMGIKGKKIAVLSGKGGTGKTLVSVNLATLISEANYVDCDIEEPNGYLFLKPKNIKTEKVTREVPIINHDRCIGCKKCVGFCKFNALAYTKKLIGFENACHSCGGCILVCPEEALSIKGREIGRIEIGESSGVNTYTGFLKIGEPSGTPIIEKLLHRVSTSPLTSIIDAPPGSACTTMDSIKDADYCILVAEPTIFGAHNLEMVYDLVELFEKPFGVVLNKTLDGENPSKDLCLEKDIKILLEIPFDEELGRINSKGHILINESKKYKEMFGVLLNKITKEVGR